jgi:uncharacterized protein YecT (DUF1311 family)
MHANLARCLLFAATVSMAPSLAQAEDADLVQCLNTPTGSEQKRCTQELFRKASDELKVAYAGALEKAAAADARNAADGPSSAAFVESQRAWEIYRDAECKGVVGRGGGTGRMVWVFGCLAEKNRVRVEEINVPFYQR